MITVRGRNFQQHPSLVCQIGESGGRRAIWVSDTEVVCLFSTIVTGNIAVEVSNNGNDFSSDGITFEAKEMIQIVSVVPTAGNVVGGASVVVHLSQDIGASDSRLTCQFGDQDAEALLVGVQFSRQVTCKVPPYRRVGKFLC